MPNVNVTLTGQDLTFSQMMRKARGELSATVVQTLALQTAMGSLKMAATIGVASLAAMVAPTLLVSKAVAGFDASLRRAIAVGGPTYVGKLNDLSTAITDTAIKWGLSSDEIAAGVVELSKAGFTYYEVTEDLMEGVSQLAKIHQESYETVSNVVTYAYTLYKDQVSDATELMEKMNEAANISVLNINDLGSAFEYAGSTAMTSGMSIDEFLAMISSLSQVAQTSYQNIGTLVNRIFVQGAELEKELGIATGTFVVDGILNMSKFMEYLSQVPDRYEVIQKATELWGVRSVRVIQALMAVPEEYFEFLDLIGDSQGGLAEQSEDMANSIESTWQSLIETLYQPVKEGTMLEAIQQALESLKTALSDSTISDTLKSIIQSSVTYLTVHGSELISTLANLASILVDILPSIQRFAEITSSLLGFLSKFPAELYTVVGMFIMMRRFIPIGTILNFTTAVRMTNAELIRLATTTKAPLIPGLVTFNKHGKATVNTLRIMKNEFNATGMAAQALAHIGMFAVMTGMMAIITGTGPFSKALGLMAIAVSILALKLYMAAGAMSALTWGAAAIAGGLAMAAMYQANKEQAEDLLSPKLPDFDSGTVEAFATGGFVEKTGLALVHKGEYVIPKNTVENIPSYQVGGFVTKTGMAFLHKDEYVVPTSRMANIIPSEKGGNTETNMYNYDYRTINIHDPNKIDLLRAMKEAGYNE